MRALLLIFIFLSACTHEIKKADPDEAVDLKPKRPAYKESMRYQPGECFMNEEGILYRMLSANEDTYVYKRVEDFATVFSARAELEGNKNLVQVSCPGETKEP